MNQVSRDTAARPSLSGALAAVFAPTGTTPYPARLVEFTQALVPGSRAWVLTPGAEGAWSSQPKGAPDDARALAARVLEPDAEAVLADPQCLAARMCLDTGAVGVLALEITQGGQTARAMAHERLSLLSHLSFATYRPEAVDSLQKILSHLAGLDRAEGGDLQGLADLLAVFMSADYAAVARYDGARLHDLHISGQADMGKGGALPARLRDILTETARLRLCDQARAFAGEGARPDGLVFHIEGAARNGALLPLLAASAGKLAPEAARRRFDGRKWARRGAVVLGLAALSFVPVPDSVTLPAEVAALSQRVITSPLDAPLATMEVRAGDMVVAGETVLARFDTRELDLELIAAQAAYSRALLDRERARASRLAADLRTAEIEAERLAAEITLLEARKSTAVLIAPISGIVIGEGLGDLIGALLRRGDRVLQIADPGALELDVSVPQSQVAKIAVGAGGVFRPDFDPSLRFETVLASVSPAAPGSERRPLYPAQASLPPQTPRLRPGMTGVVAMNRDWQPIWRVAGRAIRDWVLLRLWV